MPILRCGDALLRPATAADEDLLVSLMPDDFDHDPTFAVVPGRRLVEHREAWLRAWLSGFRQPEPGHAYWPFVVECDGQSVGFQVLEGRDPITDEPVDSSSFLIPAARGRRLGVAMRTAILQFAFVELGALSATSSATPDNVASQKVSERVGYRHVGRREPIVAGQSRPLECYEITRDEWLRMDHLPVACEPI